MKRIKEENGWVLYDRTEELRRRLSARAARSAAEEIVKPDPPGDTITPSWSDPKDYNDAPFSVEIGNEDVILNSGAVQLTYDDLVLPGRGGFDLRLSRQYDSSKSNTEDVNLYYDDEEGDRWNTVVYRAKWQDRNPTMYVRKEDSFLFWTSKSALNSEVKQRYSDVEVKNHDGTFDNDQEYYDGYIWPDPWKTNVFLRTSKRPNDHFHKLYGLGYGWRFMLPSIEKVLTQDYRTRYKTFVHLENGLSLPINDKDNGFEDYPLKDYAVSKSNNAYTVSYKDGRKAYFDANNRLARMTDRFGNEISFAYDSTGRMNQITDTFGRVILLELSGTALTVKRQDTGEVLMTYTVENGELKTATDRAGRTTSYAYSRQSHFTRMSREETGDLPVDITSVLLTAIDHPTGARTEYAYTSRTDRYESPFEGEHQIPLLASRRDLPGASDTAVDERTFSYTAEEARNKQKDDDGELLYGVQDWGSYYTATATIHTHKNASGGYDVWETTEFRDDGFKRSERLFHRVDGAEKEVERHEYGYQDRLLKTQLDSYLNYDYAGLEDKLNIWQRITEYTYSADKRGDVLKKIERYPARPGCDQEQAFVYDGNFSIPVEQSTLIAAGRYVVQRDTLRSEADGKGKVPEWRKVYEKQDGAETLREKIHYAYDANFRVTSEKRYHGDDLETAADFVEMAYAYGSYTDQPVSQQLSGVRDIDGVLVPSPNGAGVLRTETAYDWFGRAVSTTDPNGNTTATEYDGVGRVTKVTHPDAAFRTTVYNDAANTIVTTDENGFSRRQEYTPLGKIAKDYALSPETLLVEYRYDSLQRLSRQINYDAAGAPRATISYTYDLFDQVLTKQAAGEGVDMLETHTYNPAYPGATRLEQVVTAGEEGAPQITRFTQTDPMGKAAVEQVGDLVTQHTYDRAGNRVKTVDPRGYSTMWEYDYAGRQTREINAVGRSVYTTYDALGRKVKSRDRAGHDTLFTYDAAGRLIQQEAPFYKSFHTFTRYYYDAAGNLTRQDQLCCEEDYEMGYNDEWRTTRYTYDSRGRVVDTIQYDDRADREIRTRFVYDGAGNKITQYTGMLGDSIDGAAVTAYTYDRFGKPLTTTDPMGQTETNVYDATGLLTSKTDRNGNATAYTYDGAGRVLSETVTADGAVSSVTHAHTRTGQKKQDANGTLTVSFEYDAMGRMVKQTESDGTVKAYVYDENGNRVKFFLLRGGVQEMSLTYIYDRLNRLVEMGSNNSTVVKYSYDANGNRTMMMYPQSGIYVGYTYNYANLVTMVDNYVGNTSPSYRTYSYYMDGSVNRVDDDSTLYVYSYDSMGRLYMEEDYRDDTGYELDFAYDRFGNRESLFAYNVDYDDWYEIAYTYDLNNRLIREDREDFIGSPGHTAGVTATTYAYDGNGSQLTKTTVDGAETRTYNGFGQLEGITGPSGSASFAYRPDGLRYRKTTGSGSAAATHIHLWDGQNIVAEVGATGALNTRYIRGTGLIAREMDGALQYYLFDAHGDVLHRLDASGNMLKTYRYDAFGNEIDPEPLDTNPFRYCGEYFDREIGTYYLRARNYDPRIGRFTTEDPARKDLNFFIYGRNNPVLFTDPTGMVAYSQRWNGGYTYWVQPRKQAGTFLGFESIPYLGTAIWGTHEAANALAGMKEIDGPSFVTRAVLPANDVLRTIDKGKHFLKDMPVLSSISGKLNNISDLLMLYEASELLLDEQAKRQDVIDQIIGQAFSDEMFSSSRELLEFKYAYASYELGMLIDQNELSYTTDWAGDVTKYTLAPTYRRTISQTLASFNDSGKRLLKKRNNH